MRWLYTLLLYLLTPLLLLRLRLLARRNPAWGQRWRERFGRVPPQETGRTLVWLHTASVGEVLAAAPVARALLQEPGLQLLMTTTTPTGADRVAALFGDQVQHVYAPFDLPGSVRRFLDRVQPRLYLMMETELWPNTLAACRAREIPGVLINGRLSEKSARGYQRFAGLTRPMLQGLTEAGIQNRADAERFQDLGLRPDATHITGSIKFDLTLDDSVRERAAAQRAQWQGNPARPIWIAASTHEGEDGPLLEAFAQVRAQTTSNPLLVLVPRHPERFDSVAELSNERGFVTARRSTGEAPGADVQVLVGDVMGELLTLYGASDIAFVGGSLIDNGGHNLIEPAAWGLPILSGPSLYNFAEVSDLLKEAGALQVIENAEELAGQVISLTETEELRTVRGQAAREVAEANRGALEKTLTLIRRYL